jgi:hypothetical protein
MERVAVGCDRAGQPGADEGGPPDPGPEQRPAQCAADLVGEHEVSGVEGVAGAVLAEQLDAPRRQRDGAAAGVGLRVALEGTAGRSVERNTSWSIPWSSVSRRCRFGTRTSSDGLYDAVGRWWRVTGRTVVASRSIDRRYHRGPAS